LAARSYSVLLIFIVGYLNLRPAGWTKAR